MNSALQNFSRTAAIVGTAALVASAALIAWQPAVFPGAWRCAVLVWTGPALGSLVFALVHGMTGGEWGSTLRPGLLGGAGLLPWAWLLLAPLLFFAGKGAGYESASQLAIRTIVGGAVFLFFARAARRAWRPEAWRPSLAWVPPAGALVIFFLGHVLLDDWLAALDRGWASTAFPLVWIVGQSEAGLAAAILLALAQGAEPRRGTGSARTLGIDWGTLLFAAAMAWCYVAFAQFLIVWSGNLPVESNWFARRLGPGWHLVPPAIIALNFVLPLLVLLSRRAKQSRRVLAWSAAALLAAQLVHTAWAVLPGFADAPAATPWSALLLVVALGGIGVNRYLGAVRREEAIP